MRAFDYVRADTIEAARQAAASPGTMILAGGTTLLDLAKCGVATPDTVVDITRLEGLDSVERIEGGVRIGALATMAAVARDPQVRASAPAVAQALDLAASPQIRNMATIGGNLLQRTRCPYFRAPASYAACNKRTPGSGCAALGGVTRNHAVLGTSDDCIAVYPGDLAVALVALDAVIEIGERQVPADAFFPAPGTTPDRETLLEHGEMITAILVPLSAAAERSAYLKVRDRQSYEFAGASAAVGLEIDADGRTIRDLRVALGGVATRPWRARGVEEALRGQPFDEAAIRRASVRATEGAVARGANAYKIDLVPRVVARAILSVGAST
ncbi:FAD binding domain-containing protein [Marinivivus vitaminiproducens]|uniref:FAD binding domain-containing protein n=1 Tax=Marinivivus vitaminiproducens TaxID=3035935 RepID=UPI0027A8CB82|nr:xanthine dehydrogenase family protein subunit M [Geminicoccaceae bacterium SCSIO 64248]